MKNRIITLIAASALAFSCTARALAADITDASGDFTLPAIDSSAEIFWESSDENLIEPQGNTAHVTRPPYGEGIATVVLTAYAVKGESFSEKNFIVAVEEQGIDVEYSAALKTAAKQFRDEFLLKQNILEINKNLTVPALSSDMTLTLYSDNPSVVDSDGRVFRSLDTDLRANIYFVISYGYEHFKLSFPLRVKAYTEDEVQAFLTKDAAWLDGKMKPVVGTTVTSDIVLETLAPNNSKIEWSSNSAAISAQGKLNRGEDDAAVTLTAKLTLENSTVERTYSFTVKKKAPTAADGTGLTPSDGGNPSGTSPGGGGGGGGGSSSKPSPDKDNNEEEGNTAKPPAEDNPPFSDVPREHWAYDMIASLYESGVVSGYNGKFLPDDGIKREESVKMISAALGIFAESTAQCPFADVSPDDWFYPYVTSAFEKGLVNGTGDNLFGTGLRITRQDFAVIIFNAVKEMLGEVAAGEATFADDADISEYAREAVYTLQAQGIINGRDNGCFSPRDEISRAEAAKIIYGVMRQINQNT